MFLDGEEVAPYVLLEVDYALMFEVVDGQYRIATLSGEADAKE